MAPVTIRNIRKNYGDLEVIHGIDLDIADGSFVVLLGPSGCGKSTLLRMIAGLESVTSGDVMINDKVVNDVHPKDRDIAMVFQNYALYAHMTVFDNMAFSMHLKKMPKDEIKKKVDWAASILNLGDYLARFPRQLSGHVVSQIQVGLAVSGSVWRWDERLCATLSCSCLTSRFLTSMRSCVCRCGRKSRNCTSGSRRRLSM